MESVFVIIFYQLNIAYNYLSLYSLKNLYVKPKKRRTGKSTFEKDMVIVPTTFVKNNK